MVISSERRSEVCMYVVPKIPHNCHRHKSNRHFDVKVVSLKKLIQLEVVAKRLRRSLLPFYRMARWSNGKTSDSRSEHSRFESWLGQSSFLFFFLFSTQNQVRVMTQQKVRVIMCVRA